MLLSKLPNQAPKISPMFWWVAKSTHVTQARNSLDLRQVKLYRKSKENASTRDLHLWQRIHPMAARLSTSSAPADKVRHAAPPHWPKSNPRQPPLQIISPRHFTPHSPPPPPPPPPPPAPTSLGIRNPHERGGGEAGGGRGGRGDQGARRRQAASHWPQERHQGERWLLS